MNVNNYSYVLIIEIILLLLLPTASLILWIIYISLKDKPSRKKGDTVLKRKIKKIINSVVFIVIMFCYVFWGMGRVVRAMNEPPVFIEADSNCYLYYSRGRRTDTYNIVVEGHRYNTNINVFSKLTNGMDIENGKNYECADSTLIILPALDSVIDVK